MTKKTEKKKETTAHILFEYITHIYNSRMSDEETTPRSRGLRMPVIEASHVQNVHTIWDNSWFGLGHRPRPLSSSESVLVIHARNVRITCPPSCAHSILPSLEAPRHRDVPRESQALCDATSTKWAQDPVSASLLFAYLLSHTSSRDNTQRCSAIHRASPLSWSLSLSLSLSLSRHSHRRLS